MQAQANALSFKNSFWVMAMIIASLAPLPFITRRRKPGDPNLYQYRPPIDLSNARLRKLAAGPLFLLHRNDTR